MKLMKAVAVVEMFAGKPQSVRICRDRAEAKPLLTPGTIVVPALVEPGKLLAAVTSEKRAAASRENGKRGGRPPKKVGPPAPS